MKRLISILLAALLLLSALPLAGAFSDDAGIEAKFKPAVTAMSEKKILSGFEDGSFGPEKTLTRAQAAKILCVMLEGAEKADALTKTETGFADVPASHWAAKYVAYCVDKGIVAGVGDGKFDPDGKLSSGAFAKMLLVAYGKGGATFTGADWLKNVQTAAETTFYNYHMGRGLTNDPMQRQEAAQIAFNAMFQAEADADKLKGDPRQYPSGVPETMKLLVIGSSFGNDCTLAYLFQLLQDAGVKNLTIGVVYHSGCNYEMHIDYGLQDQPAYKYYKSTTGSFKTTTECTLSGWLGHPKDFSPVPWQDLLLAYVRRSHPNAYYGYFVTWAPQQGLDNAAYREYYNADQMTMYNAVRETMQKFVVPEQRFKFIAPVGSAIQNARTSFLGDRFDRDKNQHLNKGIGRYIAAMTVCCALTGVDPDKLTYLPDVLVQEEKDFTIEGLNMKAPGLLEAFGKIARESVKNAIKKPFEITQSVFTTAP